MKKTDDELLHDIAKHQNRAAFEELYIRHGSPCYSLAIKLTGNPYLAEDAVQETMLRIWRYAGSYTPAGNARSWILKVLVRQAISMKGRIKDRRAFKSSTTEIEAALPKDFISLGEQQNALRTHLAKLPELDLKLIILYYAGDLNQSEIADNLKIPQTTISRRLHKSLEYLRSQLSKAGFTSIIPMLDNGALVESMTTEFQAPPALFLKIFKKLEVDAITAPQVRQPSPTAGIVMGITAIIAFSAAGFFLVNTSTLQRDAVGGNENIIPAERMVNQDSKINAPLNMIWRFEKKGLPNDLTMSPGDWHWRKQQNNIDLGCLVTAPNNQANILLPTRPLPPAFMVKIQYINLKNKKYNVGVGAGICDGKRIYPTTIWTAKWVVNPLRTDKIMEREIYFSGSQILERWNNKNVAYYEYKIPASTQGHRTVYIMSLNADIIQIEWRALKVEDLPPDFRGSTPIWKQIGGQPLHRKGKPVFRVKSKL